MECNIVPGNMDGGDGEKDGEMEKGCGLVVKVKQEPTEDIKNYAETTMNELLGLYGYDKVNIQDTECLDLKTYAKSRTPTTSPSTGDAGCNEEITADTGIKEKITVYKSDVEDEEATLTDAESLPRPENLSCGSRSLAAQHKHLVSALMRRTPPLGTPGKADTPSLTGTTSVCAWCQHPGTHSLTLEGPSGTKNFCSEQCFTLCRRAAFKKNKICDWCKHVRYTVNFVDFHDGDQQLQFCSEKCLNQYKMNLFCRETEEHLRKAKPCSDQASESKDGVENLVKNEKHILITPELWLKDGIKRTGKVRQKQDAHKSSSLKRHRRNAGHDRSPPKYEESVKKRHRAENVVYMSSPDRGRCSSRSSASSPPGLLSPSLSTSSIPSWVSPPQAHSNTSTKHYPTSHDRSFLSRSHVDSPMSDQSSPRDGTGHPYGRPPPYSLPLMLPDELRIPMSQLSQLRGAFPGLNSLPQPTTDEPSPRSADGPAPIFVPIPVPIPFPVPIPVPIIVGQQQLDEILKKCREEEKNKVRSAADSQQNIDKSKEGNEYMKHSPSLGHVLASPLKREPRSSLLFDRSWASSEPLHRQINGHVEGAVRTDGGSLGLRPEHRGDPLCDMRHRRHGLHSEPDRSLLATNNQDLSDHLRRYHALLEEIKRRQSPILATSEQQFSSKIRKTTLNNNEQGVDFTKGLLDRIKVEPVDKPADYRSAFRRHVTDTANTPEKFDHLNGDGDRPSIRCNSSQSDRTRTPEAVDTNVRRCESAGLSSPSTFGSRVSPPYQNLEWMKWANVSPKSGKRREKPIEKAINLSKDHNPEKPVEKTKLIFADTKSELQQFTAQQEDLNMSLEELEEEKELPKIHIRSSEDMPLSDTPISGGLAVELPYSTRRGRILDAPIVQRPPRSPTPERNVYVRTSSGDVFKATRRCSRPKILRSK